MYYCCLNRIKQALLCATCRMFAGHRLSRDSAGHQPPGPVYPGRRGAGQVQQLCGALQCADTAGGRRHKDLLRPQCHASSARCEMLFESSASNADRGHSQAGCPEAHNSLASFVDPGHLVHWVVINQRRLGEPEHTVVVPDEQPGSLRCELVVLSTKQVSHQLLPSDGGAHGGLVRILRHNVLCDD